MVEVAGAGVLRRGAPQTHWDGQPLVSVFHTISVPTHPQSGLGGQRVVDVGRCVVAAARVDVAAARVTEGLFVVAAAIAAGVVVATVVVAAAGGCGGKVAAAIAQ